MSKTFIAWLIAAALIISAVANDDSDAGRQKEAPIDAATSVKVSVGFNVAPSRTIDDPGTVARLVAFVNDRRRGWRTPLTGAPVPVVTAVLYDGDKPIRRFGAGPGFFATGELYLLSRPADQDEVREFMEIVGVYVRQAGD